MPLLSRVQAGPYGRSLDYFRSRPATPRIVPLLFAERLPSSAIPWVASSA